MSETLQVYRDIKGKLHEDRASFAEANLCYRIHDIPDEQTHSAHMENEQARIRAENIQQLTEREKRDPLSSLMFKMLERLALAFWISKRRSTLQALIDGYERDMGLDKK